VFDLVPPFFGPATRDTLIAKVKLANHRVKEAFFVPAWINDQGQPEVVPPKHPKSTEILQMIRALSSRRKTDLSVRKGVGYLKVGK